MKYFSPALLDGSVTTAKLADNSVTHIKMTDFSVNSPELFNRSVTQLEIDTVETSLAGSVGLLVSVDLTLSDYTFWPMIHTANQRDVHVSGHSTDAPGAGNARLALHNSSSTTAHDYDLDYRSVPA